MSGPAKTGQIASPCRHDFSEGLTDGIGIWEVRVCGLCGFTELDPVYSGRDINGDLDDTHEPEESCGHFTF